MISNRNNCKIILKRKINYKKSTKVRKLMKLYRRYTDAITGAWYISYVKYQQLCFMAFREGRHRKYVLVYLIVLAKYFTVIFAQED